MKQDRHKTMSPRYKRAMARNKSLIEMFYTVDIDFSMKTPAGKPHFLENRFKTQKLNRVDSSNARRDAFLQARCTKLQQRTLQIKAAVQKKNEHLKTENQKKMQLIDESVKKANENRLALLQKQIEFHSKSYQKAKDICKIQTQKSFERSLKLQNKIARDMRINSIRRDLMLSKKTAAADVEVADDAASKIQNYYRKRKFQALVKIYNKVGLNPENCLEFGFEGLLKRVENPTTQKVAQYLIIRAKKINNSKKTFKFAPKVLLSAFVFATYPQEILLKMDDQEQDLLLASEKVIGDFMFWVRTKDSSLIASLSKQFLNSFDDFYEQLQVYKSKDKMAFVNQLIGHFIELDKLWIQVFLKDDREEWASNIEEQQNMHLKRILKFGDYAKEKLESVREEFKIFAVGSGVKMTIAEDAIFSTTANHYYLPIEDMEVDSISPANNAAAEMDVDEVKPEVADINAYGSALSNEQLAHELVMDPKFELKRDQKTELELQVTEIAKKAFANQIRKEISENIYEVTVLNMIMEIKQGLLAMLNNKGPIFKEINEVLEKEFLEQQIKNNAFDIYRLLTYVGEKMLQLCAPVRDNEIKAINNEKDVASALFKILDIIEDMRLDLANFRLATIRPQLMQQCVEYEKQKFDDALANKQVVLDKTRLFLRESIDSLNEINNQRNPENVQLEKLVSEHVLNNAIIKLLFQSTPIDPSTLPETLSLDHKRLFEFQNELQAVNIVSCLTMLSTNIIPEFRKQNQEMKALTANLFNLLKLPTTTHQTLADEIISKANEMIHLDMKFKSNLSEMTSNPIQEELKELSEDQISMIQNMVMKTIDQKDAFYTIIKRRMEKLVRISLEREFKPEALKTLGLVEGEVVDLVVKITLLVKHNKSVYGRHYDLILNGLLQ